MLIIRKTGGELYMNILSLNNETLDSFLLNSHQIYKDSLIKAIERYDKCLYSIIDHKRFILIRLDERTIYMIFTL